MADRAPHGTVARAVAELVWGRSGTAKEIAARYGVTDRTLRNWRERVEAADDPTLLDLYRVAMAAQIEGWRPAARAFLTAACQRLREALPNMDPGDIMPAMRVLLDAELAASAVARRTGVMVDEAPVFPPAVDERRLNS